VLAWLCGRVALRPALRACLSMLIEYADTGHMIGTISVQLLCRHETTVSTAVVRAEAQSNIPFSYSGVAILDFIRECDAWDLPRFLSAEP